MACTIDFSRLARLNQSRWARFIRRALLRFFEIVSSSALAKNSSPPISSPMTNRFTLPPNASQDWLLIVRYNFNLFATTPCRGLSLSLSPSFVFSTGHSAGRRQV